MRLIKILKLVHKHEWEVFMTYEGVPRYRKCMVCGIIEDAEIFVKYKKRR